MCVLKIVQFKPKVYLQCNPNTPTKRTGQKELKNSDALFLLSFIFE